MSNDNKELLSVPAPIFKKDKLYSYDISIEDSNGDKYDLMSILEYVNDVVSDQHEYVEKIKHLALGLSPIDNKVKGIESFIMGYIFKSILINIENNENTKLTIVEENGKEFTENDMFDMIVDMQEKSLEYIKNASNDPKKRKEILDGLIGK